MNPRDEFINYVRYGGETPFVSLQIGSGAGFDCKLAGKEWLSEGTLDDTIRAFEIVQCHALFNIGLPECGDVIPELNWQTRIKYKPQARITYRWLQTPYGQLNWEIYEQPGLGSTPVVYPLSASSNLDIVYWYAEQLARTAPLIAGRLEPDIQKLHGYGAVSVQWNVQPFELLGLASTVDLVLLSMTEAEKFRTLCDFIREVNIILLKEVFKSGADFIFLGAPGAEIVSPKIYEEYIVPDSQIISSATHELGGLIYAHICSPIEPFLSLGYYNRMGIDLFETLSPPPVGNITDLGQARRLLLPQICTRGNIGLDILLNGSPVMVETETLRVLNATRGYKHIVAASDYLFYHIPLENVKAVVDTVKQYR